MTITEDKLLCVVYTDYGYGYVDLCKHGKDLEH